ncbi:hypothetical protein [Photobacterium kishitanii]|uniref:hypothetical protein n=1 Tax=Photobacterium kishitanii TaxID=318456 RepID=UPI002739EC23|nr:hypothetical protein [Photobacterium kishitanii]
MLSLFYQIQSGESQAQRQLAKSMYKSYLKLAFEYPEFAEPKISGSEYSNNLRYCSSLAVVEKGESKKCQLQYEWFVSRMLYTAENVLALDLSEEDLKTWRRTIEVQISNHTVYLKSESFSNSIDTYSCDILPVLKKNGADKNKVKIVEDEYCKSSMWLDFITKLKNYFQIPPEIIEV